MLYRDIRKPIIPIAVFSYDEDWDKDEFKMSVGHLEVLRFKYLALHLRKKNWRDFIHKENPISAALLSKMGYNDRERIRVKLEFFKILARLEIDLEQRNILIRFFESYLQLNNKEEEVLMEEVGKLENADEILEIPISYVERGKAIGREEVALEMLKEGLPISPIIKVTKLTKTQLEQLNKKL